MPAEGPERPGAIDAFDDAPRGVRGSMRRAERIGRDRSAVQKLLAQGKEKAAASRDRLGAAWKDLQTLLRLVRAWVTGRYQEVPWRVIVLSLTAVIYFVNPFDLIPDFLGFGLLDDIGVVGFLIGKMDEDLDRFRAWEAEHGVAPEA